MTTHGTQLARRPLLYYQFSELIAAESTRHGGISLPPYNSLNLGLNTADVPEKVQENRNRFFRSIGIDPARIVSSLQTHSDHILVVTEPGQYEGYDALITEQPNLFLTVTSADCTPILVYDTGQRAVAAVHAGWRGTVSRILYKTMRALQDQFGTQPVDCYAYIGTCIDACSFEVGNDVADAFDTAFKRFDASRNKYYVNLKEANRIQLVEAGIPESQIEISPYSTVQHRHDYFSYRAENGTTGRMIALIGRKAS